VSYALGVIAFVVALLLSVMLHEAGHFATAKAFGMKASRFFVGFGPTLWSFRRGETEYGVKAIPAGGFVKIEGMTALEELAPEDEPRAFYRQPAGQRVVVLAAGSVVHFILAILIVFGIIAVTHEDLVDSQPRIVSIARCATTAADGHCTPSDPASPAAGRLLPGDVVTTVNGRSISNPDQVTKAVEASPGRSVTFGVLRAGRHRTVVVTPAVLRQGGTTIGRIGVSEDLVARHDSVAAAVPRTFATLGYFTKSTGSAIGGLPREIGDILTGKPRNPEGAASVVDVARVSGQISSSGAGTGPIVATLLELIAELNLFVGIFNLLPLLPLDGGHVGILVFEQLRSRVYRLLGRRDPGRVDIMKVLPVTYAVVALFVGLSLILLYAGIANPIRLQ
jgi:membrane-associated protease RseP (regulator of RpoE activity)